MSKFKVQINGGEIVEVESVCVIYDINGDDLLDNEEKDQRLIFTYTPGGCVAESSFIGSEAGPGNDPDNTGTGYDRLFLHELLFNLRD